MSNKQSNIYNNNEEEDENEDEDEDDNKYNSIRESINLNNIDLYSWNNLNMLNQTIK